MVGFLVITCYSLEANFSTKYFRRITDIYNSQYRRQAFLPLNDKVESERSVVLMWGLEMVPLLLLLSELASKDKGGDGILQRVWRVWN